MLRSNGIRAKLISLPPWTIACPPISLPVLSAAGRSHGMDVESIDGNILFFNWLLDSRNLSRCFESNWLAPQGDLMGPALQALKRPLLSEAARVDAILKGRTSASANEILYALSTQASYFEVISRAVGQRLNGCTLDPPTPRARTLAELTRFAAESDWPLVDQFFEAVVLPRLRGDETAIGFSAATTTQLHLAIRFARFLNVALPNVPLIVGGTFLSTYKDKSYGFGSVLDHFDYIALHDCEETLPALLDAIHRGVDVSHVPNIVYRVSDRIITTSTRLPDVKSLKTPDYSDLDLGAYFSPRPVASIPVARGCYYDCSYCNYPTLGLNKFRVEPVETVVDKVVDLKNRYGFESFLFSVAVMPPMIAKQLSQELIRRNVDIRWGTGVRLDPKFDSALCRLMRDAGCARIDFGAESGDADVLALMHKRLTVDDYSRAFEAFGGSGIDLHAYFLMDFPGETIEQFGTTLSFIESQRNRLIGFNIYPFHVAHGSPVQKNPSQYGVRLAEFEVDRDDVQIEFDGLSRASEATDRSQKAVMVDDLRVRLADDYNSEGGSFWRRDSLPDFAIQLATRERPSTPPCPPSTGRVRFRDDVEVMPFPCVAPPTEAVSGGWVLRSGTHGSAIALSSTAFQYLIRTDPASNERQFDIVTNDSVQRSIVSMLFRRQLLEVVQ